MSESDYASFTQRILLLEGLCLASLGFNLHVALPHPLVVTYTQALDLFGKGNSEGVGGKVAGRAVRLLNSVLLSPQRVYLTHQPNVLAVSAIYLAARQEGVSLPNEWWEVWDVEREELGFCVVAMLSVHTWVEEMGQKRLERMVSWQTFGAKEVDEEAEMARMLDQR